MTTSENPDIAKAAAKVLAKMSTYIFLLLLLLTKSNLFVY